MGLDAQELTLETISKASVHEIFQHELEKLVANMMDPNTRPTTPRKLVMEFTFTPFPDRSGANCETKCNGKPAPFDASSVTCTVYFAKHNGKYRAFTRDVRQELLFSEEEEDVVPDGKTAASGK